MTNKIKMSSLYGEMKAPSIYPEVMKTTNIKFSLLVFGDMGCSYYPFEDLKTAYKKACSYYRLSKTCVVLRNIVSGEILYSRCDNDYAVDQFLRYMDDKPNVFSKITAYRTV